MSPQRTLRPWQGQTGNSESSVTHAYDRNCYLCPGNKRSGGTSNPSYESTFVFENDFAALLPAGPTARPAVADDLFASEAIRGECRVVCFSPRHDLTLSTMTSTEICDVIDLWRDQFAELNERWEWVQIFETRGAISGSSIAHPHGQIWSSEFLPNEALREINSQRTYTASHSSTMLVDYAAKEAESGQRTVTLNDHWIVVVPFWAYWPYETLVLPRRAIATINEITNEEREALAEALGTMLRAFDRLFDTPFPYCSGWHNAPRSGSHGFQLHAHYQPPLLRSADVAKVPASYELLANVQRDLTAETAAKILRSAM